MDFSPLREVRKWKEEICKRVGDSVAVHEVDAHNVVPLWEASSKLEYSARTLRGKINKLLPMYLNDFPNLQAPDKKWDGGYRTIDWDNIIADVIRKGAEVPEIEWCVPGEVAAMEVLMGSKDGFLTKRLKGYSTDRNNPLKPKALSGLSPYLHFGQISAQRCALEARKFRNVHPQSVDAFFEELIVRRELADNFCYYQSHYDSLLGAWEWARKTLIDHSADKREHIYTKEQLEKANTADPLWNASQLEMVHYGKLHGFLRMYWGKKILEWTSGPQEALALAIYLNDKYHIDGRDPNGYVGCMWSICGVHDQGWKERAVFGKIRYMNYAGCKRKFDVEGYIAYVKRLAVGTKKRKGESPVDQASIGIIEKWGRFSKLAFPGFHVFNPFAGECLSGVLSTRINSLDVKIETKTKDNVFVQLLCSIQYRVIKHQADDAFYELQHPQEQIQAYVFDVVRAHVPRMTLDALFEQKGDVAKAVLEELEKVMGAYGYNIEHILMVDIIPDPSVRKAMNEINAAQRLQLASVYKGEAEKILQVKRAEAEAESKYLGGVGVARQRQAITDGLRENILNFSHKVEGTSAKEVMDLIMITQYFDTIKDLGNSSKNTTVFLPHGPGHVRDISDQIRNGMMEATASNAQ
ncbi:Deoxyribodipyrimidine photo-lyase [Thalictrum thalictroides]|uniref:Deoxyribodipyrimidine photo-lyase n=1 Tax=Thalictrum thalictroides TaxID=46969 RepID=A0A7J6V716_THATH|nr:Deoxyribodipyrimidine photo-lyase [Thalictrum thalictroides]